MSTGAKVGLGCGSLFVILLVLAVIGACMSALSGTTTADPRPAVTAEESEEEQAEETAEVEAAVEDEEPEEEETEEAPAFPEHETLEFSGTGDTVVEVEFHDDARIARFSHNGSSNFAVWALDSEGGNSDLLVNEIGSYDGSVLYNGGPREEMAALEISADGAWEISLEPLSAATSWGDSDDEFTGSGDDVVQLEWTPEGLTTLDMAHDGSSNFAIWGYTDTSRDLLANEIGSYDGQTTLTAGTLILAVTADGTWTLTR
ncbi:hypothetical protein [Nocardiopsis valliformis]|uniref:hypothetical protein n=1 Tax=Nocardiopsis valliformis TaxID=239974 RepID=UPI00034C57AD|nr:hypothetical protein [Nocardiopsis valliformis]